MAQPGIITNWDGSQGYGEAPAGAFFDSHLRQPMFAAQPVPTANPFAASGGGGMTGQIVQQGIQMVASSVLGASAANTMMSQFQPTQSLYARQEAARYSGYRSEAMGMAARHDGRALSGVRDMMTGQKSTPAQRREMNEAAGQIGSYLPVLQSFGVSPDTLDSLMGRRGSATVMADQMMKAMRTSVDPYSGRTGYDGRSLGNLNNQLFEELYGDNADLSKMKGMSAGQAGVLASELQHRGMLGSTSQNKSPDLRRADLVKNPMSDKAIRLISDQLPEIQKARAAGTLSAAQENKAFAQVKDSYQKLTDVQGTSMSVRDINNLPGAKDLLQSVDAKKIAGKLRDMAGVTSAMREIFGDNGQPNAPMRAIVNGLSSLTNNTWAQQSIPQLEKTLSMAQTVAKTSGMGIENLTNSSNRIGGMMGQIGVHKSLALGVAIDSARFGAALGDSGAFASGVNAWGLDDNETLTQRREIQATAATASIDGNQLMMITRASKTGQLTGQGQQWAEAVVKATQDGQTTFLNPITGKKESLQMNSDAFNSGLNAGGMSNSQIRTMTQDRLGNQAYGQDVTDSVMGMQGEQFMKERVAPHLAAAAMSSLDPAGRESLEKSGVNVARIMDQSAAAAAQRMAGELGVDAWEADGAGDLQAAKIMEEEAIKAIEADPNLQRDPAAMARAKATILKDFSTDEGRRRAGSQIKSTINSAAVDVPNIGSGANFAANYSNSTKKAVSDRKLRDTAQAAEVEALRGVATMEPIARIMELFSKAGPEADIFEVAKEALGVVDYEFIVGKDHQTEVGKMLALAAEAQRLDPVEDAEKRAELTAQVKEKADGVAKAELVSKGFGTDIASADNLVLQNARVEAQQVKLAEDAKNFNGMSEEEKEEVRGRHKKHMEDRKAVNDRILAMPDPEGRLGKEKIDKVRQNNVHIENFIKGTTAEGGTTFGDDIKTRNSAEVGLRLAAGLVSSEDLQQLSKEDLGVDPLSAADLMRKKQSDLEKMKEELDKKEDDVLAGKENSTIAGYDVMAQKYEAEHLDYNLTLLKMPGAQEHLGDRAYKNLQAQVAVRARNKTNREAYEKREGGKLTEKQLEAWHDLKAEGYKPLDVEDGRKLFDNESEANIERSMDRTVKIEENAAKAASAPDATKTGDPVASANAAPGAMGGGHMTLSGKVTLDLQNGTAGLALTGDKISSETVKGSGTST